MLHHHTIEASSGESVSSLIESNAGDFHSTSVRFGDCVDELSRLSLPYLHHRLTTDRNHLVRVAVENHLEKKTYSMRGGSIGSTVMTLMMMIPG